MLAQLNGDIDKVNAAIDGAIAGIVAGAAGDWWRLRHRHRCRGRLRHRRHLDPVVIGGVAMMVAGAGGITAGAIVLHNSLGARQDLYQKRSSLNSEVLIATQIGNGYKGLQVQAQTPSPPPPR